MRELSDDVARAAGQPSDQRSQSRLRSVAAGTLVFYGIVLLAAGVLGIREQAGMATAPSWSVFHLVVVLGLAISLLKREPWAWWATLVLAVVALVLLAPLWIALLGGPGLTLLIPRLDVVLVSIEAAALAFLLVLLVQIRRAG